ncbi:hypothetical protein [Defluviitalea raffinosedens]|uniref:hypothetical protein n=1 Tax=Defluviitalea raffinosedens TaxID=1450156 RepID=UPI001959283F|nr:hypothetical protein [Defluviitalea raffinosedens]MBM7686050.1 hypothetical protein [Defluviitalea raffinosedens]
MTEDEYISWGYKSQDSIIIIKDSKIKNLYKLLSYNFSNRDVIITSLSKIITPLWIQTHTTGLLYSTLTKTEGFIKYGDFLTLISSKHTLSQHMIYFKESENPIGHLQNLYHQTISLFYGRYILIGYILIAYLVFLYFKKSRCILGYSIFFCMFLSTVFGFHIFAFLNGILKSSIIIFLSLILGGVICYLNLDYKKTLICVWISHFLLLFYFTFSRIFLYKSPIGFNNIFQGTRFYGWNNDLIGIFLGLLLGIIFTISRTKKGNLLLIQIVLLFTCILCFSPLYGANVGGMLSCFCAILASIYIFEEVKIKKILYIGISTLTFLILQKYFILWDLNQTSSTHWGIWVQSIHEKNLSFSFEIIYGKLKQIFLFLLLPPLNIFIFLDWVLICKLRNLKIYDEKWGKIFFIISAGIIFLNDSGVLSSIYMLFYFLIPIYYFSFSNE